MLASANVSDVTRNQFYVLSKFALTYPRLKAGGALLPDLIEFYQWIHTELAYLVTKKYAQKNGFEEVITKADQKYEGHDLFTLTPPRRLSHTYMHASVVSKLLF